jgi:hypothetical protein
MRTLPTVFATAAALVAAPIPDSLRANLLFHASFDKDLQADVARGDRQIYSAPSYKEQSAAKPGLGEIDAAVEKGAGVNGSGALRFRAKNTRALFFKGDRNASAKAGAVSFWLRLDPDKDLSPGFSDPIQITDKAYNDSAIWVDFTKDDTPRKFRLGVFGSLKEWNPKNLPADKNPDFLNRLVVVDRPPFTRERWTHIAITWSGLDAAAPGTATLYVNGRAAGPARSIRERFQWDPSQLAIRLGVGYTGLMDEVAVFDRALSAGEVAALYRAGSAK